MARAPGILGIPPQQGLFDNDVSIQTEDYAIGGRMITVKIDVGVNQQMSMNDEQWRIHIRQRLANQLSLVMLNQDLMETTAFLDPNTGHQVIAARCYLAPKDQVKILRVHKQ